MQRVVDYPWIIAWVIAAAYCAWAVLRLIGAERVRRMHELSIALTPRPPAPPAPIPHAKSAAPTIAVVVPVRSKAGR